MRNESEVSFWFLLYFVAFWIAALWLYAKRSQRRMTIPSLAVPLLYGWYRIKPALQWIAYLGRRKRIARFLKMARYFRVRKKPIDRILP